MKKYLLKTTALALLGMCLTNPAEAMLRDDGAESSAPQSNGIFHYERTYDFVGNALTNLRRDPAGRDRDRDRDILKHAASDPKNARAVPAAECILKYCSEEDKNFARDMLKRIASDPKNPNAPDATHKLWEDDNEGSKASALSAWRGIAQDFGYPACGAAAMLLSKGNEEDKNFARDILKRIASKPQDDRASYAAAKLWEDGNEGSKASARSAWRGIAQDLGYSAREAAAMLLSKGNEEDKNFASDILKRIASDPSNPDAYDATYLLWERTNSYLHLGLRERGKEKKWVRNHIQQMHEDHRWSAGIRKQCKSLFMNSRNVDDLIFAVCLEGGTGDAEALVKNMKTDRRLMTSERDRDYAIENLKEAIKKAALRRRGPILGARKVVDDEWAAEEAADAAEQAEQAEIAAQARAAQAPAAEAQAANTVAPAADAPAEEDIYADMPPLMRVEDLA